MRLVATLVLCLMVSGCIDTATKVLLTAPAVASPMAAGPHDGAFSAPVAEPEHIVSLSSYAHAGIIALTAEGRVWCKNVDGPWFALSPAPETPFVLVTGTKEGTVYAVDQAGKLWRKWGGWILEPGPGSVAQ